MITGALVDIGLTILLYRWLYRGQPVSSKSRKDKIRAIALRIGFAWVFPFIGIWLMIALGIEGVTGLFRKEKVS